MSGGPEMEGGVPVWGSDLARISTGSGSADRILGGGFPVNSINMIMGEPGTGKTLFAQQLVFHNAGGDRPILYLTTLSEPLAKVVKYLQGFDFFDEAKLGTDVIYDEVGNELAEEGIGALVRKVKERIKALKPKIIVIDSFKALHDISPSIAEMRRVVHDLAGLLTAYETTTFLVGEYSQEQMAVLPEFVVADGIVELLRHESGMRDDRFFRVRKLRGSSYREGRHGLRLTSGGVKIYRRLVTPRTPPDYTIVRERVATGTTGLDEMVGGGLWTGTTTLLGGPTGAGKTTIGLQFVLDGLRRGEPGLYVHLEENPTQLCYLIQGFGADPADPELHLLYHSPVELQIDSLVDEMFRLVRTKGVKRIVIDGVGDLVTAAQDARRLHDYLYALSQHFAVTGVTAMFTFETARPGITGGYAIDAPFSHLSDNILLLEMRIEDERTHRKLRVLKTRGSTHDPRVREVEISPEGVRVIE
ncbi:MAG TPA: ATPase domain-containing protein [Longimicrobiales bacterium]|nr:ATPase domain-containing protein [Longimicrobiales bacterium]